MCYKVSVFWERYIFKTPLRRRGVFYMSNRLRVCLFVCVFTSFTVNSEASLGTVVSQKKIKKIYRPKHTNFVAYLLY